MKKLLRTVAGLLLLVLIGVTGAFGYLLGTEAGLRRVLTLADRFAPGQLTVARAEGQLSSRFQIDGLVYEDAPLKVELDRFRLAWRPGELVRLAWVVEQIDVGELRLTLPESDDEPSSGPIALPDVRLPISIRVERADVAGVWLATPGGEPAQVLEHAVLSRLTFAETLELAQLEAAGPGWSVEVAGQLQPIGDYALNVDNRWEVSLPDVGSLSGGGHLAGDLAKLEIGQTLSGVADATIEGTVSELLAGQPDWNLSVALSALTLPGTGVDAVSGSLSSRGRLTGYEFQADLSARHALSGPAKLSLRAQGDSNQVTLETLSAALPESAGSLSLKGRIDLQPLNADLVAEWTDLQWPIIDAPQVTSPAGMLTLKGGVEQFSVQAETRIRSPLLDQTVGAEETVLATVAAGGSLQAIDLERLTVALVDHPALLEVQGAVEPDAQKIDLQGEWKDLQWPLRGVAEFDSAEGRFAFHGIPTDFVANLEAALGGEAMGVAGAQLQADQAPVRFTLKAMGDGESIKLDHLSVQPTGIPARLVGQGSFGLNDRSIHADLEWHALGWPLWGERLVDSEQGRILLDGSLEQYRLHVELGVGGTQIPRGDWRLSGIGDLETFQIERLRGDTLDGMLGVAGRVGWAPTPTWDLTIEASDINPGVHWPDWPGSVTLAATAEGQLRDAGPRVQLNLATLSGRLREQALAGQAEVAMLGNRVEIPGARVSLGGAEVIVRGVLEDLLDFEFEARVPDLAAALPGATGDFSTTGQVTGSVSQPKIDAALEGKALSFQGNRLESVRGSVAIDLSAGARNRIELLASNATAGGLALASIQVSGDGTPESHRLQVQTQGDVELDLAAQGGTADMRVWEGVLERLVLDQAIAGRWALAAPTPITASADRLRLERACLDSPPARLCASASRDPDQGLEATVNLAELEIARFAEFMPPGLDLQGRLNLDADAKAMPNAPPDGTASVRLVGGRMVFDSDELQPISFDLVDPRLDASLKNGNLDATLGLALGNAGKLDGRVRMDDVTGGGRIDGALSGVFQDLGFLAALTPAVESVTGRVDIDTRFSGTLDAPALSGRVAFDGVGADAVALATRFSDFRGAITADGGDRLAVDISGQAGEGPVSLTGWVAPFTRSGELALLGDRLRLSNTPNLLLYASPDLKLSLSPERTEIGGTVDVPEARIAPPDLSGTVRPSADVRIVGEEEVIEQGPEFAADLDIRMGEEVWVDAYGLEARLEGGLRIQQVPGRVTTGSGAVGIEAGSYSVLGQTLEIERGRVLFAGPVTQPALDVRAVRKVGEVTVGVQVSGPIDQPESSVFSDPAMDQTSALSYLVLGRPPGQGGQSDSTAVSQALTALTLSGGTAALGSIQENLGVDEIGLETMGSNDATGLVLGRYLTPDLYFRYGVGVFESVSTFLIRYRLTDNWNVESYTGTQSGADINFVLER
jgi:translocation and assembly module TamB